MLAKRQDRRSERIARIHREWATPRRRLDPRHYARILVLLVVTGLLTWYARKGRNNPFTAPKTVSVNGDSTHHLIRFAASDPALGKEIVLLLKTAGDQDTSRCDPPVTEWTLISFGAHQHSPEYFQSPPVKWFVVDPAADSNDTLPKETAGWPRPVRVGAIERRARVSIRWIHALDDSARMVWAELGKISVVAGRQSYARCTGHLTDMLRERADVAVFSGVSDSAALALRRCLRPLHMIAVPAGACISDSCREAGILSPRGNRFTYRFRPTTGGGAALTDGP